jgi:hypothetical protein
LAAPETAAHAADNVIATCTTRISDALLRVMAIGNVEWLLHPTFQRIPRKLSHPALDRMVRDPVIAAAGTPGLPSKTVPKNSEARTTYPHSNTNRSENRLRRAPIVKKLLKFFAVAF